MSFVKFDVYLPCPFCGRYPELKHYSPWCVDRWHMKCRKCEIYFISTKSKEDVIKKWNTRKDLKNYD